MQWPAPAGLFSGALQRCEKHNRRLDRPGQMKGPQPCHYPYQTGTASKEQHLSRSPAALRNTQSTIRSEGCRESRRCSRDTYQESYITKYTSIRRLKDHNRPAVNIGLRHCLVLTEGFSKRSCPACWPLKPETTPYLTTQTNAGVMSQNVFINWFLKVNSTAKLSTYCLILLIKYRVDSSVGELTF